MDLDVVDADQKNDLIHCNSERQNFELDDCSLDDDEIAELV